MSNIKHDDSKVIETKKGQAELTEDELKGVAGGISHAAANSGHGPVANSGHGPVANGVKVNNS